MKSILILFLLTGCAAITKQNEQYLGKVQEASYYSKSSSMFEDGYLATDLIIDGKTYYLDTLIFITDGDEVTIKSYFQYDEYHEEICHEVAGCSLIVGVDSI